MPTNDSYVGLLTFLLPYLDQADVYDPIPLAMTDLASTNQPVWYSDATTYDARSRISPGSCVRVPTRTRRLPGSFARFNIYPRGKSGIFEVRYLTQIAREPLQLGVRTTWALRARWAMCR